MSTEDSSLVDFLEEFPTTEEKTEDNAEGVVEEKEDSLVDESALDTAEEEEEDTEEKKDEEEDADDSEENTDEFDSDEFLSKVSKLSGLEVEGEFELSVEGLANRDRAIEHKSVSNFITELKGEHPKAFELLEYLDNGGNFNKWVEASMVGEETVSLLPEESTEAVSNFMAKHYESKGIPASYAKTIAQDLADDGNLYEEYKKAFGEVEGKANSKSLQLLAEQKEISDRNTEKIQNIWRNIEDTVNVGDLAALKVNAKDKSDFLDHLQGSISQDKKTGEVFMRLPMNTNRDLATAYFSFKKGDLANLVTKRAASRRVRNVKNNVSAKKNTSNSEEGLFDYLSKLNKK